MLADRLALLLFIIEDIALKDCLNFLTFKYKTFYLRL